MRHPVQFVRFFLREVRSGEVRINKVEFFPGQVALWGECREFCLSPRSNRRFGWLNGI